MRKKILVTDDSKSLRMMVFFTLQAGGYEVVEAEDGQHAIEKLKDSPVDLLITDLNMPRLDGIGLIKKVRKESGCPKIPIIVLTTETQEVKQKEGLAAGANAWLIKPFNAEQLLIAVAKVLSGT